MHALDWAIRQAELTHASVLVVMAWRWPVAFGWNVPIGFSHDMGKDARTSMEEVLEPIRNEHPHVLIESRIVEGHPSPALVEASGGADLLVVGSRGHGEFVGMLLGSVSEHCVSNARCPVLVVREEQSIETSG